MKRIRELLTISIISLFLGEIILRITGYQAYIVQHFSIEANPKNAFIAHPYKGYALNPGQYSVTINDSLNYQATHLTDSTRTTGLLGKERTSFIYGCSFAYGLGLADSLTFPFLLNKKIKNYSIQNFAVPGYGTLHAYLALKESIQNGLVPKQVIIAYAGFHEERNAMTSNYRRHLRLGWKDHAASTARFPYLTVKNKIQYFELKRSKLLFLRQNSALFNLIGNTMDLVSDSRLNRQEITLQILNNIQSLCHQHKIKMIVFGLLEADKNRLNELEKLGFEVCNAGLPIHKKRFNNWPYDSHPNALAHSMYADLLFQYFQLQE